MTLIFRCVLGGGVPVVTLQYDVHDGEFSQVDEVAEHPPTALPDKHWYGFVVPHNIDVPDGHCVCLLEGLVNGAEYAGAVVGGG